MDENVRSGKPSTALFRGNPKNSHKLIVLVQLIINKEVRISPLLEHEPLAKFTARVPGRPALELTHDVPDLALASYITGELGCEQSHDLCKL